MDNQCPVTGLSCKTACGMYCGLQESAKCRFCHEHSPKSAPFLCKDCSIELVRLRDEDAKITSDSTWTKIVLADSEFGQVEMRVLKNNLNLTELLEDLVVPAIVAKGYVGVEKAIFGDDDE